MRKLFFVLLLFCNCSKSKIAIKKNKIHSVVIIGNSIVRHEPKPSIGWYGDWGMAATEKDKDFVHILIRKIKSFDSSVKISFVNHVDFEQRFMNYDYHNFDTLKNYDMIITRFGENVIDTTRFTSSFDSLLNYLDMDNKACKVITNCFWDHPINKVLENYSTLKGLPFVSITDLSNNGDNKASGQSDHPNDNGMKQIADRIWSTIREYF